MPFDGNTYGQIALIAPIEYHPEAPSTPGVVSKSLAGAYSYCRTSAAQRIGDQTYRVFGRDGALYALDALAIGTTPQDIAEFIRYIPGHATHIVARVDLMIPGTQGMTTAHVRVVAVGTGTDTGNTVEFRVDLSGFSPANGSLGISPTQVEAEVALANITQDDQVVVTVQAFVSDSTGAESRPFGVSYVVAWWECRD